jgi:hypothetical protein
MVAAIAGELRWNAFTLLEAGTRYLDPIQTALCGDKASALTTILPAPFIRSIILAPLTFPS